MLKRKIYDMLVAWKNSSKGTTAMMIDGARCVGKSYIAEQFAKAEYKIDFRKPYRYSGKKSGRNYSN